MRAPAAALLAASLAVTLTSCTGEVGNVGNGEPDELEMAGAGGRDISEYWPTIEVPLSQNTRMLSFKMLRSEVMRATGRSWVVGGIDQWDRNRGPLGGADFVTTFADDLTPSQQRIVLIRKMAYSVCGDVVNAESGQATRTVFSVVDPAVAFDPTGATIKSQIEALFRRVYLDEPSAADISDAQALLQKLLPSGPEIAWRGLCTAYLGSMRFLTY